MENIKEDNAASTLDEKGAVFSTFFNDHLIDKSALIEENPKEIREVVVDSVTDRAECSSSGGSKTWSEYGRNSGQVFQKSSLGGGEVESDSSDDSDDENDGEAKEGRNKAVEWTEVDQKNLMDLGNSEIERNKRLESLIARRRARKLLSLQVRRTLMHMNRYDTPGQITSLMIPKNNGLLPTNLSGEFSPTPGSAPSVLLPTSNPFDIPYDPNEEKPNLTGGSFHQEVMFAQKDMMFSRHESFSLGAFFPGEYKQDRRGSLQYPDISTMQRATERHDKSKFGGQLDKDDPENTMTKDQAQASELEHNSGSPGVHVKEEELDLVSNYPEEEDSEVQTKTVLVENIRGRRNSPSSSEDDETFFRIDKDAILKSLASPAPRRRSVDQGPDPCLYTKNRMEERFYHAEIAMRHTPTHSIASDLQVEVSEVSSPPLTIDGDISSPDEDISSTYGGQVEKEMISSKEDMWTASSHLSGLDEDESRLRELCEINEQDIPEVGVSRLNSTSEDPSNISAEEETNQDSTSSHTLLPADKKQSDGSQTDRRASHLKNDHASRKLPSQKLELLELEKIQELPVSEDASGDSTTQSPNNRNAENPVDDDRNSTSGRSDVAQIIIEPDNEVNPDEHSNFIRINSSVHTSQFQKVDQEFPFPERTEPDVESNGQIPDDILGNLDNVLENRIRVDNNDTIDVMQDSEGEPHAAEVEYPVVSRTFDDSHVPAVFSEMIVQQVPDISSSSSSPKSVLQPKFSMDHISSLSYDQEAHVEVPNVGTETTEDSTSGHFSGETSSSTGSRNTVLEVESSTASNDGELLPEAAVQGWCKAEASNSVPDGNLASEMTEIEDTRSEMLLLEHPTNQS